MSRTAREEHQVKLSEYEELRLQRIAVNHARLKNLGLVGREYPWKSKTPKKKRQTDVKKRSNRPSLPVRRSKRVSGESPSHTGQIIPKKEETVLLEYIPRRKNRPAADRRPLTNREWKVVAKMNFDDYLPKFEKFLCLDGTLSANNFRRVMCQVSKLARGEGIRYDSPTYGWPAGCYFCKGTKVTPGHDIGALMEEARECEDKWGRDHGNGWLMSHPLGKLHLFQRYILTNPNFILKQSS